MLKVAQSLLSSKEIWPVVVVGGGPVGLIMAMSLAKQNIKTLLIDKKTDYCSGSRAICFSQKTLEIFEDLGVLSEILKKGESWSLSHTIFREENVATLNYDDSRSDENLPSYINLQQYYLEEYLRSHLKDFDVLHALWGCEFINVEQKNEINHLTVRHDNEFYKIQSSYVIAADGVYSSVRQKLGLEFTGKVFEEKFLVADVKFESDRPSERTFWFNPKFNPGKTALMLKQPDNIWRIDFQLGWDADVEAEKDPVNFEKRIKALLGRNIPIEIVWISVYTFQSRRLEKFRHGNIFFVGDAAHQFSPFGARGAKSGIQDADTLSQKLGLVLNKAADLGLIDTYHDERAEAADINIRHTTRSLNFISPRTKMSKTFRDAVLSLSKNSPSLRKFINSGRLYSPDNFVNVHDEYYEAFLEAHQNLSEDESSFLNASLVVLLADKLEKKEIIFDAISHAKKALTVFNHLGE